eukprot:gene48119-55119_t
MRIHDIELEAAANAAPAVDMDSGTKLWGSSYKSFTNTTVPAPIMGPRDSFDYAEDVPISLYTGNPATGAKMSVQGTSAGTGRNPFSKNAAFSTPIDRHPTGGKHGTLEY